MTNDLNQWVEKINSADPLTPENRQEIIVRYLLWSAIALMGILAIIRGWAWIHDRSGVNSFYLANALYGILAFLAAHHFNNRHRSNTASIMMLVVAYHMCLTSYPIRNLDQVLLYFALPTAAASFIRKPKTSLVYALFCFAGSNLIFALHFPTSEYPMFSTLSLFMIAIISWQVATTLQKMADQITAAYDKTIEGWSQALEMRSQETDGHSQRVTELTLELVKRMKVNEVRWAHIRRGVLLHDIGKMGIPDNILCKPGPLNSTEIDTMHNHPCYARDLLSRIPYLAPALDIPYCHHERWDGHGYPCGLKGEEIPLEVRIFTVVDVWDAMRSPRSYRPPVPESQVIEYLISEAGRSFDPLVVNSFLEMMGFSQRIAVEEKREALVTANNAT